MKSNEYGIGFVLRFSSIEIHLDLEFGQDWGLDLKQGLTMMDMA